MEKTKKVKMIESTFRRQDWTGYFDNGDSENNTIIFDYKDESQATYNLSKEEYPVWREILLNMQKEKKINIFNKSKETLGNEDVLIGTIKEGNFKGFSQIIFSPKLIDKLNGIDIELK